jgi:transcriptional regulator with XRE-family HTH domain
MDFSGLKSRLLLRLRVQLRNGELTERRLAQRIGLSQSHVHNVLKGKRDLTVEVADRFLCALRMSVLDLLELEEIVAHVRCSPADVTADPVSAKSAARLHRGKYRGPGGRSVPSGSGATAGTL